MASPQKERGFAPIANELLEALTRTPTVGLSARIMLWVARNTYGYRESDSKRNRKVCKFSWTEIADQIDSHRQHVSRAGNELVSARMLVIDREAKTIGLQKDYDRWEKVIHRHGNGAHQSGDGKRHGNGAKSVTGMVRLYRNTDNRQQTLSGGESERDLILESFNTFWTAYPKRRGYGPTLAAWRALAPSAELVSEIMAAIQEQVTWDDWTRGERWIPKPERWLAEKRWLDKGEAKGRVLERKPCRKCSVADQHSMTWPFCKGCTWCSKCEKDADKSGTSLTWHLIRGAIFCGDCRTKEK